MIYLLDLYFLIGLIVSFYYSVNMDKLDKKRKNKVRDSFIIFLLWPLVIMT